VSNVADCTTGSKPSGLPSSCCDCCTTDLSHCAGLPSATQAGLDLQQQQTTSSGHDFNSVTQPTLLNHTAPLRPSVPLPGVAPLPCPPCSNQPTFDLDPAALEKRYKLLQWQLHPDKTVLRSPEEQQFSAEQATRVNQAYGVLRNPLSRANYLVRLNNLYWHAASDAASSASGGIVFGCHRRAGRAVDMACSC
jgi:hypothetical protein